MSKRIVKMETYENGQYSVEWVEIDPSGGDTTSVVTVHDDINDLVEEDDDIIEEEYLVDEEIIPSTEINTIPNSLDQIAAENLIYMAHDGNVEVMGDLIEEQVDQVDNADYNEQQYFECQVTEEVITDDWVQQQGEERVEIPVDQLGGDCPIEQDIDVPLPTDQDEYVQSRPYPCDFCSRRFRKKSNLMNHMIAHKNDRPHICNLCGARYIRRVDLLNHLKVHAQIPDQDFNDINQVVTNRKTNRKETKPRKAPKQQQPPQPKPPKEKKPKLPKQIKVEYVDCNNEHVAAAKFIEENLTCHEKIQTQTIHYPIIDPARPFVCQQCGVSFAREKALMSHAKMHVSDAPYECDSCSEIFWDVSLLHDHQKLHHTGQTSNSEYEPDQEKDFSDSDMDSKFGEFFCPICGMAFHRHELLKRHQSKCEHKHQSRNEKYSAKPHCCNVCGESFYEALDLLAHAEMHARVPPLKCLLCGESFLDESSIKRHISTFHAMEITDNTCRLCGKQCRDSRTLMKHSWEHSREKNYSCSKCGKTFHNKARLKRHMQSHRNKSVICEVCKKHFPDGRMYMNHRHSHNNVSGRQFPCKECDKTFGSRSSQQIHMRIHTGERPYGCRFCWKAFADGGTLRKHERIHTGEKPYACPVCPRAFNQRVVLREHIRSHHSGPDSKHSTIGSIYTCSVCGDLMPDSQELIQHLIEHSDTNTAMKRQPPTGPRKYKRRRKLKPHELERLRMEKSSKTSDNTDDESNRYDEDIVKQEYEKEPKALVKREKQLSFSDCSFSVFCNLENALQNIDPLVVPTKSVPATKSGPGRKRTKASEAAAAAAAQLSSRPKMIHTEKTRVPIVDGKRKSKTLITRTSAKPVKNVKLNNSKANNVRRTVHVNSKTDTSNDNGYARNLSETELLLELSKKKIKYSPDVVNDLEEILRSPIKFKDSTEDLVQTDNENDLRKSQKWKAAAEEGGNRLRRSSSTDLTSRNDETTIKEEPLYNMSTDEEVFTCEMCSAVFGDRAQLLIHVPIHI